MIGTATALIGSAVIGAGVSTMAAGKNSKAIKQGTAAETAANAAALADQKEARAQNLALQAPIYAAGMPAMQARNALLGLGGGQQAPQGTQTLPTTQPNALAQFQGPNPDTSAFAFKETMGGDPLGYMRDADAGYMMPAQGGYIGTGTPVGNQQNSQQAAANAFDVFRTSTGYQFRLGEGQRALNAGYAGAGTIQSGAAMKAALTYGQNFASNEFGNYFGMLGEQQNLTAGAANAMSGVNTTYANNAGNLAVANGQTLANAAVARANNSNALIGSIGNAAGSVLGYYGGLGR